MRVVRLIVVGVVRLRWEIRLLDSPRTHQKVDSKGAHLVVHVEVMHHPHVRERAADRVDDEDQSDEEGEDLVREARAQHDDAVEVDDGRENHVNEDPDADPRVEGEEGHVHRGRDFVQDLGEGEDRSGAA